MIRATSSLQVASGILSVDRYAASVAAYMPAPDRFIVGLGGAHGPQPVRTIDAYLDRLDAVPTDRTWLPSGRACSSSPATAPPAPSVLITTEYAARARQILGPDRASPSSNLVVLEIHPARAREIGRGPLRFLTRLPGYAASFRRMGFTEDELKNLDDRLVDAVIAWGDESAVEARVNDLRGAGADHVALSVLVGETGPHTVEWRRLAALSRPTGP